MKKILFASLSVLTLLVVGTGCLKDKDYENQAYGTQVQSGNGVGFPAATKSLSLDLGVTSSTGVDTVLGPYIALESSPRTNDIHVDIQIVDDIVTNAVDENGDPRNLSIMPTSNYSFVNGLNRTIRAGFNLDSLEIVLSNSAVLDPNQTYGIGLRITGVDNGVDIISDRKDYLVTFTIRNQYDGIVELKGKTFHPTNASLNGVVSPYLTSLITLDANSVKLGTSHRWADGSGSILSPTINPVYTVDPATNDVTISDEFGATAITNTSSYHSYYDPATKTIFAEWTYPGSGGNRIFTDTLTWIEPRP